MQGLLGFSEEPLVSTDFRGDDRSSIVDAPSTMATGDHLVKVVERIGTYHDLLTSILEANLTQVSVRQNNDMRKISAWVAIAAVPTMLAGIWGMNFKHMPEIDETWALVLRMPPPRRAVVVLHYYEDLPLVEVARILGRPDATVRSDHRRALDWLREELAHDEAD